MQFMTIFFILASALMVSALPTVSKATACAKPVQPVKSCVAPNPKPVTPVRPAHPVKPVTPVRPVQSCVVPKPVAPVRPVQPCGPVRPSNNRSKEVRGYPVKNKSKGNNRSGSKENRNGKKGSSKENKGYSKERRGSSKENKSRSKYPC